MVLKARLLFHILLFLLALQGFGQVSFDSQEELEKAANAFFDNNEFANAKPLFSQLLSKDALNPNYNYRFGVCILFTEADPLKPLPYIEGGASSKGVNPEAHYFLGKAYQLNYRFDDAIKSYEKGKTAGFSKPNVDLDRSIQECRNGKILYNDAIDFEPAMDKEVLASEFYRPYDFRKLKGKVIPLPPNFKTKFDEKNLTGTVVYTPTNSQTLVYASYGEDGANGKDLYRVNRLPNGELALPQRLPSTINTKYDEDYAFYDEDSQTLYFASQGHNTMGGYDVFSSKFDAGTNNWSTPLNLQYPINSPFDDFLYVSDPDGKVAFFTTERNVEEGKLRVLKTLLHDPGQVEVSVLEGSFEDKTDSVYNYAALTVLDPITNEVVGKYRTHKVTGKYLLILPPQNDYTMDVGPREADGFKFDLDVPVTESTEALKQSIVYDAIGEKGTVTLTNFFDATGNPDSVKFAETRPLQEVEEKMIAMPDASELLAARAKEKTAAAKAQNDVLAKEKAQQEATKQAEELALKQQQEAEEAARQAELAKTEQAKLEATKQAEELALKQQQEAEEAAKQSELAKAEQAKLEATKQAEELALKQQQEAEAAAKQAELAKAEQAKLEATKQAEELALKQQQEAEEVAAKQAELAKAEQAKLEAIKQAEELALKQQQEAEEAAKQAKLAKAEQAKLEATKQAEELALKQQQEAEEAAKQAELAKAEQAKKDSIAAELLREKLMLAEKQKLEEMQREVALANQRKLEAEKDSEAIKLKARQDSIEVENQRQAMLLAEKERLAELEKSVALANEKKELEQAKEDSLRMERERTEALAAEKERLAQIDREVELAKQQAMRDSLIEPAVASTSEVMEEDASLSQILEEMKLREAELLKEQELVAKQKESEAAGAQAKELEATKAESKKSNEIAADEQPQTISKEAPETELTDVKVVSESELFLQTIAKLEAQQKEQEALVAAENKQRDALKAEKKEAALAVKQAADSSATGGMETTSVAANTDNSTGAEQALDGELESVALKSNADPQEYLAALNEIEQRMKTDAAAQAEKDYTLRPLDPIEVPAVSKDFDPVLEAKIAADREILAEHQKIAVEKEQLLRQQMAQDRDALDVMYDDEMNKELLSAENEEMITQPNVATKGKQVVAPAKEEVVAQPEVVAVVEQEVSQAELEKEFAAVEEALKNEGIKEPTAVVVKVEELPVPAEIAVAEVVETPAPSVVEETVNLTVPEPAVEEEVTPIAETPQISELAEETDEQIQEELDVVNAVTKELEVAEPENVKTVETVEVATETESLNPTEAVETPAPIVAEETSEATLVEEQYQLEEREEELGEVRAETPPRSINAAPNWLEASTGQIHSMTAALRDYSTQKPSFEKIEDPSMRKMVQRMRAEDIGRVAVLKNMKNQWVEAGKTAESLKEIKSNLRNQDVLETVAAAPSREEYIRPPFNKDDLKKRENVSYRLEFEIRTNGVSQTITETMTPEQAISFSMPEFSLQSGYYETLSDARMDYNDYRSKGFESVKIIPYLKNEAVMLSDVENIPFVD
ncbi:MAG: hypothetical protein K9J17_03720 [Flavobacteriales bacterium]|nr:hypothetical protein [Flavobacteriales bacterium]